MASATQPWIRKAGVALCAVIACYGLYLGAGVTAAFIADPHYDAERWMRDHIARSDTVEIYGLNAYLPRFPQGAVVSRVGPKPLKARNPLPDVREVQEPYRAIAERRPRFIVVPGFWVRDYLEQAPTTVSGGRAVPRVRQVAQADVDARSYFKALFSERLPYTLVHKSAYTALLAPPKNAYESLAQPVFVFEYTPAKEFVPFVTGLDPEGAPRL